MLGIRHQRSALSIRTAEQNSVWEHRGSATISSLFTWPYNSTPNPDLSVCCEARSIIDRNLSHAQHTPDWLRNFRPGSQNQICTVSLGHVILVVVDMVSRLPETKDLKSRESPLSCAVQQLLGPVAVAHGGALATCRCVSRTGHRRGRHFIKKEGRNVVIVFWGAFTEKES